MRAAEGGVCAPRGFTAAGVAAGIKPRSTKLDCALIVSDRPAAVAGTFTKNLFKAPPVRWSEEVCARGQARAVFINSGNANACTGRRGREDVETTARALAEKLGAPAGQICVCSTGVIGQPLPMDRILSGVEGCVKELRAGGSRDAAMAIMTTDTVPKEQAVEVELSGGTICIGAIAKGSGMVAPDMATMICVLTTDAAIEPSLLKETLRNCVESSFNRICIDNDMSTSDIVLCLANGAAGLAALREDTKDYELFARALRILCQDMAKALVRDGEGATKFVEIEVTGAATDEDAKTIARAIAHSHLCKTAFFGQDANWGRIACAAGYSGAIFDPDKVSVWVDDVQLMRDGQVADYREEDAAAVMRRERFRARVALAEGNGHAVFWTCDLSYDYVRINAEYRT